MDKKTTIKRFLIALLLALSALGISKTGVLAAQPSKYSFSFTDGTDITNICSFPIHVNLTVNATEIDFYDGSGALTKSYYLFQEQDTFSANGKTLVGDPYTAHIEWLFDSSGSLNHIFGTAILEKVRLPDGSLFIATGRVDFFAHSAAYLLTPDKGNPGNLAGFCAALAP